MQVFIDKIQFNVQTAELADLDKNWNTRQFNPTYRYLPLSRLYMPCSGKGYIVCNDKTYVLKRGSMFLIPPYAHIQVSCPKKLVKYWCHFNAPVSGFGNDIFSMYPDIAEIKITEEQFEFNAKLFECMIKCRKKSSGALSPGPLEKIQISSALAILLEPFLRSISQKMISPGDMNRIMKLVQYMNENLSRNITLKELAGIAGVHPNYLCGIFLRAVGNSPIAYLLNLRMAYAMAELRRNEMRISEISENIGFRNQSSFSLFFRRRTGISPREWQKINNC